MGTDLEMKIKSFVLANIKFEIPAKHPNKRYQLGSGFYTVWDCRERSGLKCAFVSNKHVIVHKEAEAPPSKHLGLCVLVPSKQ